MAGHVAARLDLELAAVEEPESLAALDADLRLLPAYQDHDAHALVGISTTFAMPWPCFMFLQMCATRTLNKGFGESQFVDMEAPVFVDDGRSMSKLEEKYIRELRRAPMRGELMKESVASLKVRLRCTRD